MTACEILENKEVLRVEDFMIILNCGKCSAYKVMRNIKRFKDSLEVSGRILKQDYIEWKNRDNKNISKNDSNIINLPNKERQDKFAKLYN